MWRVSADCKSFRCWVEIENLSPFSNHQGINSSTISISTKYGSQESVKFLRGLRKLSGLAVLSGWHLRGEQL